MDIKDLLDERASCRAFAPRPVDDAVLDAAFGLAQRTPSWCNTQPWRVHLLSGGALATFGAALREHVAIHPQRADLGLPVYSGASAQRRRDSGHGLYAHLGIARDDHVARGEQMLRNFDFFDAPHLAVLTVDADLGAYGVLDCGGYVSTLMLALADRGIGTCALGSLAMYSDAVRRELGIESGRSVVCGIAIGHPADGARANSFRTTRAPLSEVLTRLD